MRVFPAAPMDTIFTVTTLHMREPRFGPPIRTVGWFPDLATATEIVEGNYGDIHETVYRYAVIEEVPRGLYPAVKKHWFEWNGEKYQPCSHPAEIEVTTCAYSMG